MTTEPLEPTAESGRPELGPARVFLLCAVGALAVLAVAVSAILVYAARAADAPRHMRGELPHGFRRQAGGDETPAAVDEGPERLEILRPDSRRVQEEHRRPRAGRRGVRQSAYLLDRVTLATEQLRILRMLKHQRALQIPGAVQA